MHLQDVLKFKFRVKIKLVHSYHMPCNIVISHIMTQY